MLITEKIFIGDSSHPLLVAPDESREDREGSEGNAKNFVNKNPGSHTSIRFLLTVQLLTGRRPEASTNNSDCGRVNLEGRNRD